MRNAKGFQELGQACDALLERAARIDERAAARIAKNRSGADAADAALGVLCFEAAKLSERTNGSADSAGRPTRG